MAGTDCFAPRILAGLLCCFSLCFYSITITRVFNGVVVFIKLYVSIFIRLIDFDLTAHTRSILQLFHDNSIMVFNTVSCFDKAIVFCSIIIIRSNRIRLQGLYQRHAIFIKLHIFLCIRFKFIAPFYSIPGNITFIMTKGNGVGGICGCLISQCRGNIRILISFITTGVIACLQRGVYRIITFFSMNARCCNNGLIAGSQSIASSCFGGAACNTYRYIPLYNTISSA